jgi:hypothetical protein
MERMTYFENGRWYLKDGAVVCPIPRNNAMLCAAVEKLAAYENTKLSPAEISRLQEQRGEKKWTASSSIE